MANEFNIKNGFISNGNSTVTGTLKSTTLQLTSGATNGYVLTSDAIGNATWQFGGTNLSNILFVSKNGNDNTAVKGDLHKSYANLYAAKSAATSGDTIYVLPGTWVYDNRDSAGNPYNGANMETLVNLWKNGVSWYFSPGSKIIHYNQTQTGQDMDLFRPSGFTYETCTVKGYLEYETFTTGPDTFNGYTNFFNAQEIVGNTGAGYNFNCEVKSIVTSPNSIKGTRDNVISTIGTVYIKADYMSQNYLGGQTGTGSVLEFRGNGLLDMIYDVKKISYNVAYGIVCRNFQVKSKLVCNVQNWDGSQSNYSGNQPAIKIQGDTCRNKTINVGAMYFKYRVVENLQGSDILNLNGDLYDIDETQNGTLFQYWNSGASTLNYNGNISLYSAGRAVTYTSVVGHKININGNIILSNATTAYTASLLYSDNGTTEFSGNIYGNNAGNVAMVRNGNVNINNSYIKSTVSGSRLVENTNTATSIFRLNNSYVELKSEVTPLINSPYMNQFINNSTLINIGSGDTISNSVSTGKLQILNSNVISSFSGATSINYSGASATVISSNSTVNTNYTITNLNGNITILTDMIY
jgi:hypothetical protein